MIVAYNSSLVEEDEEYVRVDPLLNPKGGVFNFIYGQSGSVNVLPAGLLIRSGTQLF
ncbi:hypothetical protein [Dyadobacter sp. BHUBP1]|uniref:hypothetical protein n=1 Tax=Dyadobacter sp. BHUBP1 TaxID=3424178 RepID=UPI003D326420